MTTPQIVWTTCLLASVAFCGVGCQSGEPWTIEVIRLEGEGHRRSAADVVEALKSTAEIRADDVSVEVEDGASVVYYGRYSRRIDRVTGERDIPSTLRRDLAIIKDLGIAGSAPLFMQARMVPKSKPDVGPAAWDLSLADGVYSLQVAVFFPAPEVEDYKAAAVAYVRQLREEGYEAFYYHGEANTVVTIGVFGKNAAFRQGGKVDYSAAVRALQEKEHFAYNLNNGRIWHSRVDGQRAPVRSLLVKIPKRNAQERY